jgi:hypothetical protein
LFFLGPDNGTVMSVDLDTTGAVPHIGTPKILFSVRLATLVQNRIGSTIDPFDVGADGKRFLGNSVDRPETVEPINLILNWDAEVRK